MDDKYNVDDILLEIKSRKKREKENRADQDPVFPTKPARRPVPVEPVQPREPEPAPPPVVEEDVIFPDPAAFAPREPKAAPRPAAPAKPAKSDGGFHFALPEDEPVPDAFAAWAEPAAPDPEPEPAPPPPPEPQYIPPAPEPEPPQSADDGGFFSLGDLEEKSNPLDFEGHVQSITDRAKIRHQRMGRPPVGTPPVPAPPVPDVPSIPVEPAGDTAVPSTGETQVLDLRGAFGALDSTQPIEGGDNTRVLPKLGLSRELDLRELQDMDFGPEHDDYGMDDEFDDDLFDGGLPAGRSVDFSEYNSVSDRREVAIDIARVKLWLVIRLLFTTVLTVILFYLVVAGRVDLSLPEMIWPENDMRMYMMSLTAVTVLVAVVNSSAVGGGLISLFKMRANSDSLAALALVGSIGQCVYFTMRHESVDPSQLTIYCCVAAAAMLFNAIGKMTMISRIQQNFKIISSNKPKQAVLAADQDDFCREFVREPTRRPTVALSAKCDFFTDFLALSYSDKYDVGINRAVAPASLLGAIAVCVLTYMLTKGDMMTAISAFTAILCVAATFSSTFIENVPLGKLTKKLAPQGGMVSGNKAVEDFCDTHAIVLTDNDLFPTGHVRLNGIKTHSQGRVDEAILDAASVVCASGGALSEVFLQMIGGNRKLLKKVDNLVFENGMGISAWVDSRRVLIGNRALMQNHGIALPDTSFQQKYADDHGEAIFLSNAGEVCAQFVVNYQIDEELALELDNLALREKTLVVYTMDPNITPGKVWEVYGYPEELIRIMPAEFHTQYQEMTRPREAVMAEIAYTGKAAAKVGAIIACIQARSSILTATIVQLVQVILGYGLIALMAFMGVIETLSIVELCVYQLFWFIAILLVQKLKSA